MRKIHRIVNIALIFTLIEVFLCQNLYALRVPMAGHKKVGETLASGQMLEDPQKPCILRYVFDEEKNREAAIYKARVYMWTLYYKLRAAGWDFPTDMFKLGSATVIPVNVVTAPVYEMALNIMMHGKGGTIEIYEKQNNTLQAIGTDKEPGINSPDRLWREEVENGRGFRAEVLYPASFTIETNNREYAKSGPPWQGPVSIFMKEKERDILSKISLRHINSSSVNKGTKITMEWPRPKPKDDLASNAAVQLVRQKAKAMQKEALPVLDTIRARFKELEELLAGFSKPDAKILDDLRKEIINLQRACSGPDNSLLREFIAEQNEDRKEVLIATHRALSHEIFNTISILRGIVGGALEDKKLEKYKKNLFKERLLQMRKVLEGLASISEVRLKKDTPDMYIAELGHDIKKFSRVISSFEPKEPVEDELKAIIVNRLKIDGQLTKDKLQQAIEDVFKKQFSDGEKRALNREIALALLKGEKDSGEEIKAEPKIPLAMTRVAGASHSGPFDISIKFKTSDKNGGLEMVDWRYDTGGRQAGVSKVFRSFEEPFGIVAISGKEGGEINDKWTEGFSSEYVIPSFAALEDDKRVNVLFVVDGVELPLMIGWYTIPEEVFIELNERSIEMLRDMLHGQPDKTVWFHITAGGGIRYDKNLRPYGSLAKEIKNLYQARVQLVLDFKWTSTDDEILSVLEIPRDVPQDIVTPNVKELILILEAAGLVDKGVLSEDSMTDEEITSYALMLMDRYNLLGVFATKGERGLQLVLTDRVVKEDGIKVFVENTLGAGDATKAAFTYALSLGRSWEQSVHSANLFGAATVTLEGTQVAMPFGSVEAIASLAQEQGVTPITDFFPGSNASVDIRDDQTLASGQTVQLTLSEKLSRITPNKDL